MKTILKMILIVSFSQSLFAITLNDVCLRMIDQSAQAYEELKSQYMNGQLTVDQFNSENSDENMVVEAEALACSTFYPVRLRKQVIDLFIANYAWKIKQN